MSLQRGINLRALAEKMGQCSGAEVRGICTEAGTLTCSSSGNQTERGIDMVSIGMYALRERRQHVTQEDFEFAIAKVSSPIAEIRHCAQPLWTGILRRSVIDGDHHAGSQAKSRCKYEYLQALQLSSVMFHYFVLHRGLAKPLEEGQGMHERRASVSIDLVVINPVRSSS